MVSRRYQGLWAAVLGCLVGTLTACASPSAPSTAAGPQAVGAPSGAPAAGGSVAPIRVLQLNLCNSGIAACYTGRSTSEAATVIESQSPDLVTLNEICQGDLTTLQRSLAEVVPDGRVVTAFRAAQDRRTGDVYRCRNGQPYGIGVVSRWPSVSRSAAGDGIYPRQDTDDPEERAWLCLGVVTPAAITVCTTHLAYTKLKVARAQCTFLFRTVIAQLRQRDPAVPVVFGGDLNLGSSHNADLTSCLPAGSADVDDGGVQHVVATPEYVVTGSERIDLRGATDHQGLLVTLSPRMRG